MKFLSCWKWDADASEWKETGQSVNFEMVEKFGLQSEPVDDEVQWRVMLTFASADIVRRCTFIAGATSYDHACRFFSAVLVNAGIEHWPPLPDVEIETVRKPGTIGTEPPSRN